jgi:uncharacterized protein YndB with AHSA1/START domain
MTLDPITRRVLVPLDADAAFRLFAVEMPSWWPMELHSRREEHEELKELVVEPAVGGRIFERMTDGTECAWGVITAWEPGRRLRIDWKPNDDDRPPTDLEVTFAADPTGGTVVELVHSGWERLGSDVGAIARAEYAAEGGWGVVLERGFVEAAGART